MSNRSLHPASRDTDASVCDVAGISQSRITDAAAFGHVAVLMGGTSSEREVSLDSGRNVLAALRSRGVRAQAIDGIPALMSAIRIGRNGDGDGNGDRIDRVFNILHGNKGGGEDGVLQGLLDAMAVPYTGSGVLGSALSMDKIRSKQVWLGMGLPTPAYARLKPGNAAAQGCASVAGGRMPEATAAQGCASVAGGRMPEATVHTVHAAARELGLPVIVKPASEGSSVGISRVFDDADLDGAIELAARYMQATPDGEMLMEQLIEGDELTVAILRSDDVHHALPSIRIVPKGAWYDYDAKYVAQDTQYLCPGLEGEDEMQLRRLSLAAFEAVGCSGWGRVDVMRDRSSGALYLLEVNTAPGMTSHSLVPKAAAEIGIDFEELCWRILETSL